MTIGAGKYDDLCEFVAQQAGIKDGRAGAAIVIILNGNKGHGFSCACDPRVLEILPESLETVARDLRADREKLRGSQN
jgi:hypothetical protein